MTPSRFLPVSEARDHRSELRSADNLLGIDLGPMGVTANEGIKSVAMPNDGMDYPVITAVSLAGGMLSVSGLHRHWSERRRLRTPSFRSSRPTATLPTSVERSSPAMARTLPHGEGAIFLNGVMANGLGQFDTTFTLPAGVTLLAGDALTATATDQPGAGNTSEFGANAHLPIVLDIDANGVTDPLTDGLLVLRFLFGFTGTTLTNGAVGQGCMRCTASEIASHITQLDLVLDIDDNDQLTPLTDALMILRYLFGFTGTTLTGGAVGGGCGRCDAAAIAPYLQSIDS